MLISIPPASAAAKPVYDSTAASQGAGTRSWTHTNVAPAMVFAALGHLNRTATAPGPCTIDGAAMTFIGMAAAPSGEGFISLFRSAAAVAAGGHPIVMSTGENYDIGMSVAYTGVGTVTLLSTLSGSSTAPNSGAFDIGPSELLMAAVFLKNTPSNVTAGISRQYVNHSSGYNNARMMEGSGASPQSMAVTQAGNNFGFVTVKLAG